jgi:TatD DNase family protein
MINYIDIHTHKTIEQKNILSIINLLQPVDKIPEGYYFSSGWHPWDIEKPSITEIKLSLQQIIQHERIIALGECGLDRLSRTAWNKQLEVFIIQLQFAEQYEKPLIIHCVKAYSDLLHILKIRNFKGKIVLHGFNGNVQMAEKFMKYNSWFSFGKLLFSQNKKQPGIINDIPAERLFFETDEADFSISDIYIRASEILGFPLDQLIERVKRNFNEFLGYGLVK